MKELVLIYKGLDYLDSLTEMTGAYPQQETIDCLDESIQVDASGRLDGGTQQYRLLDSVVSYIIGLLDHF